MIAGNPGKRKLNMDEPEIKAGLKDAPDWMDDEQLKQWQYAIDEAPAGVLGTIDRDTLAVWVTACVYRTQAIKQQAKIDAKNSLKLLTKTTNGNIVQSPYMAIINKQAEVMMKAAAEMGFTPSSRTRLTGQGSEKSSNPFDQF